MGSSITQASQKSARSGRRFMIVFGLVFAGFGLLAVYLVVVPPVAGAIRSRNWVATPCMILDSRLESSHDSESESDSYRIAVRFRYQYNGQSFVSQRYTWSSAYTGGRAGKQQIVDRLQVESRTTCYVNPRDPSEAVLKRDIGWDLALGLIPMVFVVIGLAVMYAGIRRKTTEAISDGAGGGTRWIRRSFPVRNQTGNGWVAVWPPPARDRGEVELRPSTSPGKRLIGLSIFALLWNGFVGCWAWFGLLRSSHIDTFGVIFLTPFALVGAALLVGVGYSLMALNNPRPVLTLARSILRLGESVDVRWKFSGAINRISSVDVRLEGREIATYRRGTSTYTDKHVFERFEIARVTSMMDILSGQAILHLPARSAPSFRSANNRIEWVLIIHGDIPFWPDVKEEFTIDVYAPKAAGVDNATVR